MNEYILTILAIISVIGLGFLLLITFGIDFVAYFGIGLVVVSILGSFFYTWWKTQSDKTTEKMKTEMLIRVRKELREVEGQLAEASKIANVSSISRDLALLCDNLIKQKFFDNEYNISKVISKYTLTFIEQEGRKAEQKLRSLEALAAGNCRPQLEKYVKELQSKLDKLKEVGYGIGEDLKEFDIIAAQPSKSLREMLEKKSRLTEKFEKILEKCVEEVASMATASRRLGDTSSVERAMVDIKKMKGDFDATVFNLVNARKELKDLLRDTFSRQHSNLVSYVKNTLIPLTGEHVDSTYRGVIEEMRDHLLLLSDPGKIQELKELETTFKSKTAFITNELFTEMKELEKNIRVHQPHERVWLPDNEIASLVDKVNPADELKDFSKHATIALDRLSRQLEKDIAFVKIIENYAKVEPLITRKLKEDGTITKSDLNIKYAEKFLLLYSLKNENTEFEENPPNLTLHSDITAELKQKLLSKKRA